MNRLILLVILIFPLSAQAEECDYTRTIKKTLDATTLSELKVIARAGSLEIAGYKGGQDIQLDAKLCASSKKNLKRMDVSFDVDGKLGKIKTQIPSNNGLFFNGNNSINLVLKVPQRLSLDVDDSSGSAIIEKVAALNIDDSSGSLVVRKVAGDVNINDSSGSIEVSEVQGSVFLSDSSGSISAENVSGDVLVKEDGSGSISAKNVGGDFVVNADGSGSISALNIGRHFWVRQDGSGGISYKNVGGTVDIPDRKK